MSGVSRIFLSLVPALLTVLILTILNVSSAKGLPKYGPNAKPFSANVERDYFKTKIGPDFTRLFPFYIGQDTGSGCSLAAMTTLMNAVQAMGLKRTPDGTTKNFVMSEMRHTLLDPDYVVKVSGDPKMALLKNIRLGVSISELRDILEKTMIKADLTLKKPTVQLVLLKTNEGPHRNQERAQFFDDLKSNEASDQDFIMLNFVQGVLTGDPDGMIGHVAMVAAFDSKTKSVLILDPDREYYQPYWASAEKVFEAIAHAKADRVAPGYLKIIVK